MEPSLLPHKFKAYLREDCIWQEGYSDTHGTRESGWVVTIGVSEKIFGQNISVKIFFVGK